MPDTHSPAFAQIMMHQLSPSAQLPASATATATYEPSANAVDAALRSVCYREDLPGSDRLGLVLGWMDGHLQVLAFSPS